MIPCANAAIKERRRVDIPWSPKDTPSTFFPIAIVHRVMK